MSDNDQPPASGSSLKGALKKRKTQEIDRVIEARRMEVSRSVQAPANEVKRSSQVTSAVPPASSTEPKRASQTVVQATPAADPKRTTTQMAALVQPGLNRPQKRLLIGAVVGVVVVVAVLAISLFGTSSSAAPAPTDIPLPLVSANDVISYLKKVGVPISNVRTLPTAGSFWQAKQQIEFDVQRDKDKGSFIVLSYASVQQSTGDELNVSLSGNRGKYKNWQTIQLSNIIVAIPPDTSPNLSKEIGSHLYSYLIVPYRSFLPTVTPTPSPQATATTTK